MLQLNAQAACLAVQSLCSRHMNTTPRDYQMLLVVSSSKARLQAVAVQQVSAAEAVS